MALRAVAKGEKAPVVKQSVSEAAKTGDRRGLLVAMRDRIADAVSKADCPYRDLASLTKRLDDISREIAKLDAIEAGRPTQGDDVGDAYDASAI